MAESYDEACARATTDQGLDPVVAALGEAGIAVVVEQTGGFCMVATVYKNGPGTHPYLGITCGWTAAADGYLVCQYLSGDDDGTELADAASLAEVVKLAGEFTGVGS